MKRYEKTLKAIEYNDFRRQFLVEINKKLREREEYLKNDYVKIRSEFTV